jgi:hypothetical protein
MAVRKLLAHARERGSGHNYLIQHSAGSGKSNSIAWLAHQLANLCGDDEQPVFDSIVVITDRRVLDRQLQDTIKQFEKIKGTVTKIDKRAKQLTKDVQVVFAGGGGGKIENDLSRGIPLRMTNMERKILTRPPVIKKDFRRPAFAV